MNRLDKHFWLERTSGMIELVAGVSLFIRPFADALQTLDTLYHLSIVPQALGAALLLTGAISLFVRNTHVLFFALLLSPFIAYSFLLGWRFLQIYQVGFLGTMGLVALWAFPLYIHLSHSKRKPTDPPAP